MDAALDLQGLLKSAVLARLSGASRVFGFPSELLRESGARFLYTDTAGDAAPHVIDKNLRLAGALGAAEAPVEFPIADVESAAATEVEQTAAGPFA